MYDMGTYLYCPAESPHKGGLIMYPDGLLKYPDRRQTSG